MCGFLYIQDYFLLDFDVVVTGDKDVPLVSLCPVYNSTVNQTNNNYCDFNVQEEIFHS